MVPTEVLRELGRSLNASYVRLVYIWSDLCCVINKAGLIIQEAMLKCCCGTAINDSLDKLREDMHS